MADRDRKLTHWANPAGYLRKSIEEDWQPPPGFVSRAERERRAQEKQKARLLQELRKLVTREGEDSELLKAPKEGTTIKDLEQEIARIKAEGERRKKEQEAEIERAFFEMTQEELKTLKEDTLASVNAFHRAGVNYSKIAQKDIRDLGDESLTEAHIREIRDEVIRERFLGSRS